MDRDLRLREYPLCGRALPLLRLPPDRGYRLAVLAERFGVEALVVDVLEAISSTCLRNKERHPGRRCQAFLPDLLAPRPTGERSRREKRIRVIIGGKA